MTSSLINPRTWRLHLDLPLFPCVILRNWFIYNLSSSKAGIYVCCHHWKCGTQTAVLRVSPRWRSHSTTRNTLVFYKVKFSAVIFTKTFYFKSFCALKYILGIDSRRNVFSFLMLLLRKIKSQCRSVRYNFLKYWYVNCRNPGFFLNFFIFLSLKPGSKEILYENF